MTEADFRELLRKATLEVVAFTREYVWNPIPDRVQYRVFPNQSFDLTPDGQSLTDYPQDTLEPGTFHLFSSEAEVVSFLWREGRVPCWVNVQIEEATHEVTSIDLVCCGRYTDDVEQMYYTSWQMGP